MNKQLSFSPQFKVFMVIVSVLILFFIGCEPAYSNNTDSEFEGAWFVNVAAGYQIDELSHQRVRKGCHVIGNRRVCNGENPEAKVKIGYEFSSTARKVDKWIPIVQIYYQHNSHYFQGWPFNKEGETHREAIFIGLKWGGIQ